MKLKAQNFVRMMRFTVIFTLASSVTGWSDWPIIGSVAQGEDTAISSKVLGSQSNFLVEVTIADLQKMMETGEKSSYDLTVGYIERILRIDHSGIRLNSVIEINPDALTIARALDRERREKGSRGPLHGIPILLKDNMDTNDRMLTTAGSWALLGSRPQRDAGVAARLRAAGAILLGKANLSELSGIRAFVDGKWAGNGWSGRGGHVKNPYILEADTWGSSAGSAVSVSANLAAASLGSDTGGSIILPASSAGVVGLRPTVGLVSRAGVIPLSKTSDTVGPIARTVSDAAILLGALTGVDPDDDATKRSAGKYHTDYRQFLKKDALHGKRIGILKNNKTIGILKNIPFPREIEDILHESGAVLVEITISEQQKKLLADVDQLAAWLPEMKDGINSHLKTRVPNPDPAYATWPFINSLDGVIKFNQDNPKLSNMGLLGQWLLSAINEAKAVSNVEHQDTLNKAVTNSRKYLENIFKKHDLDVFIGPLPLATFPVPASMAGYPRLVIPYKIDLKSGLPVSIELTGVPFSEPELLGIGYALEQATKGRTPPSFALSANQRK